MAKVIAVLLRGSAGGRTLSCLSPVLWSSCECFSLNPDGEKRVMVVKKDAVLTDAGNGWSREKGGKEKRNPIMRFFGALVPHIGDGAGGAIRKTVILLLFLGLVGAMTALIDDLVVQPVQNEKMVRALTELYNPESIPDLTPEESAYPYPRGIDPSFKKLYCQNSDIRGWISFHSTDGTSVNIEYPVLQSSDNDYYLTKDFTRAYNVNGSCFFDYRNDFSGPDAHNDNLIIYGHNMASWAMFAQLNRLLYGLDYARVCPTFTMNTIYHKGEYKVFAVMVCNTKLRDGIPFNYTRTSFQNRRDFAQFLAEIRARSLYNYDNVDLLPTDEIVTLSTCNTKSNAHFRDGRTVVVARKIRKGESADTDVSLITNNTDVIMPYAWYANQRQVPHPYYSGDFQVEMENRLAGFFASENDSEAKHHAN